MPVLVCRASVKCNALRCRFVMFTIGEYIILKFLASTLVIWARLACKRLGKDSWTAQAAAGQPSTLAEQTPVSYTHLTLPTNREV